MQPRVVRSDKHPDAAGKRLDNPIVARGGIPVMMEGRQGGAEVSFKLDFSEALDWKAGTVFGLDGGGKAPTYMIVGRWTPRPVDGIIKVTGKTKHFVGGWSIAEPLQVFVRTDPDQKFRTSVLPTSKSPALALTRAQIAKAARKNLLIMTTSSYFEFPPPAERDAPPGAPIGFGWKKPVPDGWKKDGAVMPSREFDFCIAAGREALYAADWRLLSHPNGKEQAAELHAEVEAEFWAQMDEDPASASLEHGADSEAVIEEIRNGVRLLLLRQ